MNAREILGWNIRKVRVAKGLSQERLALATGLDRAYAGRIERGSENVTIDRIEALARTLDVEVAQLFAEPPTSTMPPALQPGRKKAAS